MLIGISQYGPIKRIEHFWKGLSHPDSQISAIPPDRYGDRFIHFISGITKSKELAEREQQEKLELQQQQQQQDPQQPDGQPQQLTQYHPRISLTVPSPDNISPSGPSPQKADAVVERAERQAMRGSSASSNAGIKHPGEGGVPDRQLGTVQTSGAPSPSGSSAAQREGRAGAEKTDGTTLPVVEEVGESGSVGERSRGSSRGSAGDGILQKEEREKRSS
jgi:1-phosphatidylinositol-4-phosphate 5-kinase